VKNTSSPLSFFMSDWGFGNYGYRPLHSLSLWIGYRLFGVSSGPNQWINLVLHITVVLLLYALIVRLQRDRALAFGFSALSLISLYTFSPPTWISDRPTLFVAFFLLITLNYFARLEEKRHPNFLLLVCLSILALMSKESGLVVPLISIGFLTARRKLWKDQVRAAISLFLVILAYALLRFILFGSSAGAYEEAGYLFGIRYYETSASLTGVERLAAFLDNAVKNVLAIFLPVFNGQGKFSLIGTLSNSIVLTGATMTLFVASIPKKFSAFQKIALLIIILNALLHMPVFRYRTLYLAEIGLSIILATSPAFGENQPLRRAVAFAALVILLIWSIHIIGEDLTYIYLARMDAIREPGFEQRILAASSRIDPGIVNQIIAKYRH